MKNTTTKMKNKIEENNSSFNDTDELIRDLENKIVAVTQ